ncbi:PREDICTED: cytokine receptor-like factor 1 [Gavialis gangeticus]|uniref:cytokine receptor-like factor 1 n=1 Tax=Gavialis gangeticus TaxID=94835 RepID=UPI00092E9442|nr:PREDICTED: cytokine receptor-like factor 1 [Gavialis gangeticus]
MRWVYKSVLTCIDRYELSLHPAEKEREPADMAGLLNYYFLICATIVRISSRYLEPKGVSSHFNLQCFMLYPKYMSCHWSPQDGARPNATFHLRYKMRGATEVEECKDYITQGPNSCYFSRVNLCLYLTYEIWVETTSEMSEKLVVNTEDIAKTEPPTGLTAEGFGTHLSVEWQYPPGIAASFYPLVFELWYQEQGSREWKREPNVGEQISYSLEDVTPGTTYRLQVRCKHADGKGFWSEWSAPITVQLGWHSTEPAPNAEPQ